MMKTKNCAILRPTHYGPKSYHATQLNYSFLENLSKTIHKSIATYSKKKRKKENETVTWTRNYGRSCRLDCCSNFEHQ